jgi:hypothetical protein
MTSSWSYIGLVAEPLASSHLALIDAAAAITAAT